MDLAVMSPTPSNSTGMDPALMIPTAGICTEMDLFWHLRGSLKNETIQANWTINDDANEPLKVLKKHPSQVESKNKLIQVNLSINDGKDDIKGPIKALRDHAFQVDASSNGDFPAPNGELKASCARVNGDNPFPDQHENGINWETISVNEAVYLLDRSCDLLLIETIVNILHKARQNKALFLANLVHTKLCSNGLEDNEVVGNHIVPMFVECGSVSCAQNVFNRLVYRNEFSWTSLILGYLHSGKLEHALHIYEEMLENNVQASSYTIVALLQAHAKLRVVRKGIEIHLWITKIGLEEHIFIGSALVDLYANCGLMLEAQSVFERLPVHGVVSWNALIAGYAEHGPFSEVLKCIQQMQLEEIVPNAVTYSCCLKACGRVGDIEKVRRLYAEIVWDGFESDICIGNSVIGMYARCGSLLDAQEVFDTLPIRDVISWNALITGYVEHGPAEEVLNLLKNMSMEGTSPNVAIYTGTLKACCEIGCLDKGRQLHVEIIERGMENDLSIANSLVDMYSKFTMFSESDNVFGRMPNRDIVSWTALIAGYVEYGANLEALKKLKEMQQEGISPDAVTYICILKACGNVGCLDRCKEMHRQITYHGLVKDIRIQNSLIGMYVKCGSLKEARDVFDEMPFHDVISWTTLITGLADNDPGNAAIEMFKKMRLSHISPNAVTLSGLLKSCSTVGDIDTGQEIHREIVENCYEEDELVSSSLVCMYAKCGLLSEAEELMNSLRTRSVVPWNALLSAYAEHISGDIGIHWFTRMQVEGVIPDVVTYSCILKVCANVGAIEKGRRLHEEIIQKGLEQESSINNSIINMYFKCGSLLEAQNVFDMIPVQDVVAWSSMIIGYGVNHQGDGVLRCFENMRQKGIKPDAITFTRLLTACSHSGLVREGQEYLRNMREYYDISPTVDHLTSMVNILARSGHLYEAEMFIEMICPHSEVTWGALLTGCRSHGEAELGLRCFQKLIEINSKAAAWYVLMGDIYADVGRWENAYRIEGIRRHFGAKKKPGAALIELNDQLHEFIAGHEHNKEITEKLVSLNSQLRNAGHRPHVALVLKPISDQEKEVMLCEHAEKVAIAFGLLNTPDGVTLRVSKNLRMCVDCHDASKIISRIERREIILRDDCCIHHFRDGSCSCQDMF